MINCANNSIDLKFDEKRGMLISLINNKKEYVKEKTDIFKLSFRDIFGNQSFMTSGGMTHESSHIKNDRFVCTYSVSGIKVKISCELSDEIIWNIDVKTPENLVCEWVNYPQIAVDYDLAERGGNSKILWGFNEGIIVDNIEHRESCFGYREPGYPGEGIMGVYPAIVETQFMAYYNDEGGLYFAAHDRNDYLKGIDFYKYNDDSIMLQFRHFCGGDFGKDYTMEYPMVMKFFDGGWYSAARIYRDWFEKEKKEGFVPIKDNKKLPNWYGESPVVVTYPVRGVHDTDVMEPNKLFPYINAMPHIERLEKELDSKIMVILMHWEGTAPWAPPYVWPPFGGEEELKKFIDALHKRGDVIGVYCSGMGWTQQSRLIEEYNMEKEFAEQNLERYMCKSPAQELPYSKICPAQRVGYDMCPTQEFTVNVLKEEVRKMAGAGIDYIQLLDQNHGGNSYFCYSREHGHPPVPGKWQTDAVKALLDETEKEADGKILFGCESAAAESYIPQLLFSDNRFNLNYSIGCPVPVYAYIYHKYLNNFMGNQVSTEFSHERSPENIFVRLAYAFTAGDMITLVLNQDGDIAWNWGVRTAGIPEQESIKQFVKTLNSYRRGCGRKYLHTGEMIKPYCVTCGKNTLYLNNGYALHTDKIFTSAWKSDDGKIGQFLVNYNDTETVCGIKLPEKKFSVHIDGAETVTIDGGLTEFKINPYSAVLIEDK